MITHRMPYDQTKTALPDQIMKDNENSLILCIIPFSTLSYSQRWTLADILLSSEGPIRDQDVPLVRKTLQLHGTCSGEHLPVTHLSIFFVYDDKTLQFDSLRA